MKYQELAKELEGLLGRDQHEWMALANVYLSEGATRRWVHEKKSLKKRVSMRIKRALEILAAAKEPSLTNIGHAGAVALSVLALHASLSDLETVLTAFQECHESHKDDCPSDLIPAMLDWALIQKGQPQEFGTQWMFDENRYPFLPTISRFTTFEELNERRAAYGREPHRWPKSLAIPEEGQSWLKRPLSEAIMRMPTKDELARSISEK